MTKFNPDRLRERLERLNRDELARLEKLSEELLERSRAKGPPTKRAGPRRVEPDNS